MVRAGFSSHVATPTTTGCWLLITTRANWARLRERGEWVFASKHRLRAQSVRVGDEAVVYLTAGGGRYESSLGGLIEFTGPVQETEDPGAFDQLFPWSIPLRVIMEPIEPVHFRPLIPHLSFIGRGRTWGSALQGQPIKKIGEIDFRVLKEVIQGARRVTG